MTTEPPRPDDSSSQAAGDGEFTIPDEVFDRLLADSEAEIRKSAPKEASARARMVAQRLRREDEAAARSRSAKGRKTPRSFPGFKGFKGLKGLKGRKAGRAEPGPWRAGPDVIGFGGRRRMPRWARNALATLVVAGVAAVVLNPSAALSLIHGGRSGSPDVSPSGGVASFAHPFAGVPAEQWAGGAGAIAPPAPRPVGAMSGAQVAAALQSVKDYLVETNLDPRVLRGGVPRPAIDEIDPLQNGAREKLEAAFRSPGGANNPLDVATRYNPAELKPVGGVVKVRGQMTFRADVDRSVLVSADYTFVYAFTKADGSTDQVVRVIMRRAVDMRVSDPALVKVTAGKLWLVKNDADFGNAGCDVHDGYVHPQFGFGGPSGGAATGSAVDPYDRSRPLDPGTGGCGRLTRS